jgi:hypothetical protein
MWAKRPERLNPKRSLGLFPAAAAPGPKALLRVNSCGEFFSTDQSISDVVPEFELLQFVMEQTSGFYTRALRAIGQDLAGLVPENLVIEFDGRSFVAHGLCSKSRIEQQNATGAWKGMKKLVGKVSDIIRVPAHEPDLEFVSFSRNYGVEDLDRLDADGSQFRGGSNPIADIYSLAERLRTIGKLIDGHNGHIIKIFKDLHHIRFDYRNETGQVRTQELSNTELYQLQQRYAATRSGPREAKSSNQ